MKFDEFFDEPQCFSDGSYVIHGKYSREEAAEILSEYLDDDVHPDDLEEDAVRYGFPPEGAEDGDRLGNAWWGGARGRGSKKVWVLER